jgi:hypothetical protein
MTRGEVKKILNRVLKWSDDDQAKIVRFVHELEQWREDEVIVNEAREHASSLLRNKWGIDALLDVPFMVILGTLNNAQKFKPGDSYKARIRNIPLDNARNSPNKLTLVESRPGSLNRSFLWPGVTVPAPVESVRPTRKPIISIADLGGTAAQSTLATLGRPVPFPMLC